MREPSDPNTCDQNVTTTGKEMILSRVKPIFWNVDRRGRTEQASPQLSTFHQAKHLSVVTTRSKGYSLKVRGSVVLSRWSSSTCRSTCRVIATVSSVVPVLPDHSGDPPSVVPSQSLVSSPPSVVSSQFCQTILEGVPLCHNLSERAKYVRRDESVELVTH